MAVDAARERSMPPLDLVRRAHRAFTSDEKLIAKGLVRPGLFIAQFLDYVIETDPHESAAAREARVQSLRGALSNARVAVKYAPASEAEQHRRAAERIERELRELGATP